MNDGVVVTGIGLVTPVGAGLDEVFEALCAPRSGLRRPPDDHPVAGSAEVAGIGPDLDATSVLPATEARTVLGELTQSDDVAVLASSARLLGRLDDFGGCIQALTRAIERQPSAELFVARGLCQHGKRDEAAAQADFQRAIQKDGSYAPAHYYAGMHLKTQGKKKEARAALSRAVELAGDEGVGKAAKRALEGL